jgi:hypothetical protein
MIRRIPSRYGYGIAVPSAEMVSRFGWGFTPLRYVSRRSKQDAPKALKKEPAPECQPMVVMAPQRKPVQRAPRRASAAPWELRRAEYLAAKDRAS